MVPRDAAAAASAAAVKLQAFVRGCRTRAAVSLLVDDLIQDLLRRQEQAQLRQEKLKQQDDEKRFFQEAVQSTLQELSELEHGNRNQNEEYEEFIDEEIVEEEEEVENNSDFIMESTKVEMKKGTNEEGGNKWRGKVTTPPLQTSRASPNRNPKYFSPSTSGLPKERIRVNPMIKTKDGSHRAIKSPFLGNMDEKKQVSNGPTILRTPENSALPTPLPKPSTSNGQSFATNTMNYKSKAVPLTFGASKRPTESPSKRVGGDSLKERMKLFQVAEKGITHMQPFPLSPISAHSASSPRRTVGRPIVPFVTSSLLLQSTSTSPPPSPMKEPVLVVNSTSAPSDHIRGTKRFVPESAIATSSPVRTTGDSLADRKKAFWSAASSSSSRGVVLGSSANKEPPLPQSLTPSKLTPLQKSTTQSQPTNGKPDPMNRPSVLDWYPGSPPSAPGALPFSSSSSRSEDSGKRSSVLDRYTGAATAGNSKAAVAPTPYLSSTPISSQKVGSVLDRYPAATGGGSSCPNHNSIRSLQPATKPTPASNNVQSRYTVGVAPAEGDTVTPPTSNHSPNDEVTTSLNSRLNAWNQAASQRDIALFGGSKVIAPSKDSVKSIGAVRPVSIPVTTSAHTKWSSPPNAGALPTTSPTEEFDILENPMSHQCVDAFKMNAMSQHSIQSIDVVDSLENPISHHSISDEKSPLFHRSVTEQAEDNLEAPMSLETVGRTTVDDAKAQQHSASPNDTEYRRGSTSPRSPQSKWQQPALGLAQIWMKVDSTASSGTFEKRGGAGPNNEFESGGAGPETSKDPPSDNNQPPQVESAQVDGIGAETILSRKGGGIRFDETSNTVVEFECDIMAEHSDRLPEWWMDNTPYDMLEELEGR